jgi:hypothetical protein
MPATSFDYAIVRVVPCVEREEFLNVGVILFCREKQFLDARIWLDKARLTAFAPSADVAEIEKHLNLIPRICAGDGGPVGQLSRPERFHWLVNPRSTSIQVSPVHTGICDDPATTLDHLMETMVLTSNRV